jgi:hypothetical protein
MSTSKDRLLFHVGEAYVRHLSRPVGEQPPARAPTQLYRDLGAPIMCDRVPSHQSATRAKAEVSIGKVDASTGEVHEGKSNS